MSKFVYVRYRQALPPNHEAQKLSPLFGDAGTFESHEQGTARLFVWNKTLTVSITPTLDFVVFLSPASAHALLAIKHSETGIEAFGDAVGSRALWYYADNEKLIVASSQRAIVALLGNYRPAQTAWSWMLSNGSLGPGFSWDERIQALPAGAVFRFDLLTWKPVIRLKPWLFACEKKTPQAYAESLAALLEGLKADLSVAGARALLTLSGGYDSRAALYLLKQTSPHLHTATWGIPAAFDKPATDAAVARQVSKAWQVPHYEYNVQLSGDFDAVLYQFLLHGEGRNDHINSFMDGLSMWKTIAAAGYQLVVRADEAFGWLPVRTGLDARTSVALARFSDFSNLPAAVAQSLPAQVLPHYLERNSEEGIEDYRDRIYQQYRLPFVIGPLQDPALSFVEILNPLLHPALLQFVRTLPPSLRTGKKLYAGWVDGLLPSVPYATLPAIPEAYNIAEATENKALFEAFLHDAETARLFGKPLMDYLQQNWKPKDDTATVVQHGVLKKLKRLAPVGLKKFLRNTVAGYQLNVSSLALRAYIIYKMQQVMKDTAR